MAQGFDSIAGAAYGTVSGWTLFLVLHLLGLGCFVYIAARRLAPIFRAQRDLRFDRPLARLGAVLRFWLGAMEASAVPVRRCTSHSGLCRLPDPREPRILSSRPGHLGPFCRRRSRRPLRRSPRLCLDGGAPVHGSRGRPPAGLSAAPVCAALPGRHFPARFDRHSHGGRWRLRGLCIRLSRAAGAERPGYRHLYRCPGSAEPLSPQFLRPRCTLCAWVRISPMKSRSSSSCVTGRSASSSTWRRRCFRFTLRSWTAGPSSRFVGASPEEELDTVPSFGVKKFEDFTWKHILDFYSCADCGRCSDQCPANAVGRPLAPRTFSIKSRDYVFRHYPVLGPSSDGVPLAGGLYSEEEIWSCTTCGACEAECPLLVEYIDKIVDLRRGLVDDGKAPQPLHKPLKSLESRGNPFGKMRKEAGRLDTGDGPDSQRRRRREDLVLRRQHHLL